MDLPIQKGYLDGLRAKVIEALNWHTGTSQKAEHLFLHCDEVTLVESGSGFVRVRFNSCGPNSKVCNLVRYFASFDQNIWLECHPRVQEL